MVRKQEAYAQQGQATRDEHERILRTLGAQADEALAALEVRRADCMLMSADCMLMSTQADGALAALEVRPTPPPL